MPRSMARQRPRPRLPLLLGLAAATSWARLSHVFTGHVSAEEVRLATLLGRMLKFSHRDLQAVQVSDNVEASPKRPASAAVASGRVPRKSSNLLKASLLQGFRIQGGVSASGDFAGSASYTLPEGHSAKVEARGYKDVIKGYTLQGVDGTLSYNAQGLLPTVELTVGSVEGFRGRWSDPQYTLSLAKDFKSGPSPQVSASITKERVTLGASVMQPLNQYVDVAMTVGVPYNLETAEVEDTSLSAEGALQVGGSKVVGTLLATSATGFRGSQVSTRVDW